LGSQFAQSSGPTNTVQTLLATPLPSVMPTTGCLPTDPQPPRDFGLRMAPRKQWTGTQANRLLCRIIRATARIPFHAECLAKSQTCVTSFCEHQ
jgi:hypothetical protein